MSAVVDAARGMLGWRWRHMGRDCHGVDCLGLAILAYRAAGHDVPEPPPYRREPQGHSIMAGLEALGARLVPMRAAQDGDLLLFRVGVYAAHVGILSTHPTLHVPACVHAYLPRRCVVEEPLGLELAPQLVSAWRMEV